MKLFSTLFASIAGISAFAQTVHLNPFFGNSGIVITPNTSEINRIAIDPNGVIFSAGYSIESGGTGIYHLTVAKNGIHGAPISNFGTNGLVITAIDYSEYPLDIQLQTDGKILVAGSSYLGPTQSGPGDYHSFVVRYNTNGSLDNTFGNNGIFKLTHSDSHVAKMILLPNGSVFLAGNSYGNGAISKINSSGVPDPNFGNGGSKFLSDANFTFILWDAILLSDNTILCVGYDGNDLNNMKLAYCKLDLNGNFVSNFGQNGKVVMDVFAGGFPEASEFLQKAIELPNGQIAIGGQAMGAMFMKINPDGTPVSNFGNNGILNHPYPYADFEIQADGKFLIGGSHIISDYNAGFSITRLNADGTLDNSFNGTGTFTADLSTENDYLQQMKLKNNGHILVGGSSGLLSTDSDFMLADIDINQTLGLVEENMAEMDVYPNPFSNELHISVRDAGIREIQLMDAGGRIISRVVPNTENTLHLKTLAAGVYQLAVIDQSGKTAFKKLVKE